MYNARILKPLNTHSVEQYKMTWDVFCVLSILRVYFNVLSLIIFKFLIDAILVNAFLYTFNFFHFQSKQTR